MKVNDLLQHNETGDLYLVVHVDAGGAYIVRADLWETVQQENPELSFEEKILRISQANHNEVQI